MGVCNHYQIELYVDLMSLVLSNKSFLSKDCKLTTRDSTDAELVEYYRIFNYRLPSYSDFCLPGALECRGIMYEIKMDESDRVWVPHRLVSHPMEKFFNLHENPFTMDMDLSGVDFVEEKADGSLISTFLTGETQQLRLKSRNSLESDQLKEADEWLNLGANTDLNNELKRMAAMDYTVNLEWISARNQIVVPYTNDELRVLNVRSNVDGTYLDRDHLPEWATELKQHWIKRFFLEQDPVSFVKSVSSMTGVEGFVLRMRKTGRRVKIKTVWYMALHQVRGETLKVPAKLIRAVLESTTDDLKSVCHGDDRTLEQIAEMETFVRAKYAEVVELVEGFYEENKYLSQKEYATIAKRTLAKEVLALVMTKYRSDSHEVSYKDHLLRRTKDLAAEWEMDTRRQSWLVERSSNSKKE